MGKLRLLIFNCALCMLSSVVFLVDITAVQILARFFIGISAGIFTVVCPKYLNETVPFEIKGPVGAFS